MQTETIEKLAETGGRITYTGASVSGVAMFLQSQFFSIAGLLIALLGLLINLHYRRKANARLEAEHHLRQTERQLRIDLMRKTGKPIPAVTDFGSLGGDE
jgi:hypothetical protein